MAVTAPGHQIELYTPFGQRESPGAGSTGEIRAGRSTSKRRKCDRERLLRSASVCSRIAELKQLVCNNTTQRFLELAIIERDQRLTAIQDRWDRLREAIVARAAGDYKRMMATGVVVMKLKSVRGKNNVQRVYREYEIDTGVIEALNSVEKRAAIETGQEQENVNLTGHVSAKSITLSKVLTIPELEALQAKMDAAMEAEKNGKVVEAPK